MKVKYIFHIRGFIIECCRSFFTIVIKHRLQSCCRDIPFFFDVEADFNNRVIYPCSDTVGMTVLTNELQLNTRVCAYTHHHRWYFCSEPCFLFAISHSRVLYVHKLE